MFIAEKSGLLWYYDAVNDPTPTLVADLRASVHNFWDRGMLGLAVARFPARPSVYVSYTHDAFANGSGPRWGSGNPTPSTTTCPTPPGPTSDGCVIYGRLSRIS